MAAAPTEHAQAPWPAGPPALRKGRRGQRFVPHLLCPRMTATTETQDPLPAFLEGLPGGADVPARSLVHAWQSGGGGTQVGQVAIRLTAQDPAGATFTAATLYAQDPRLELCRVILEHHDIGPDSWLAWSDELADLTPLGFDGAAKYPSIRLERLSATHLARLVTGMRDLARLATRNNRTA